MPSSSFEDTRHRWTRLQWLSQTLDTFGRRDLVQWLLCHECNKRCSCHCLQLDKICRSTRSIKDLSILWHRVKFQPEKRLFAARRKYVSKARDHGCYRSLLLFIETVCRNSSSAASFSRLRLSIDSAISQTRNTLSTRFYSENPHSC